MKKLLISSLICLAFAFPANAENIGECGWGSKFFDGQRGIAPQVMAATTNGSSGNQTFAISSGTSGCNPDGMVRSSYETAMYLDNNMEMLAYDVAVGEGESLEALASLLSVKEGDKATFNTVLHDNFSKIFSKSDASTLEVYASLKKVLSESDSLSQYATLM